MYGKAFEAMFRGSMYGAGLNVFAVWAYVIANAVDSMVELNPKLLSNTLGGTVEEVEAALEYLTRPDPESHNEEHDGRRIVRQNGYSYMVPSWEFYRSQRTAADRRAYNTMKQAEYRERMKEQESKKEKQDKPKRAPRSIGSGPSRREIRADKLDKNGDREGAAKVAAEGL